MRQLKPHQSKNRDGIIAALSRFGGALDASDTGTGKSATFLAVCRALGARPAIVTRKAIISGWQDECRAMGVDPLFITNYEAARSASFPFGRVTSRFIRKKVWDELAGDHVEKDVEIKNYEWLTSGRVLFCFDEVQGCRSQTTLNTKMLTSASRRFKTCMASATPFTSPTEAFGIGAALRMFPEDGFWTWMMRRGVEKDPFGQMRFVGDLPGEDNHARGLKFMEALHAEIFPRRGVRTTRYEIPGFPDEITLVQSVDVDDPGAIERAYLEIIQTERQADYDRARRGVAEDIQDLVTPLAVTLNLRARQEAELHKCAALAEEAREARAKGESVAIFVNFDYTIETLRQLLKTDCVVRGEQNPAERAEWIRQFQANRQDFILVNNAAGGAGVSLHDPVTQRPRTSLISPPWSAPVLKQVLGRTLRLGGGFSTRKLLFAAGTVEERVMKKVQRKTECLDTLTDGDLSVLE